ncbi:MAG: FG-GAP repeat protein [Gemmatimonadetes bacterium]|nr:FG-GAP repeat protein [Gemmatimonadota bacterium]
MNRALLALVVLTATASGAVSQLAARPVGKLTSQDMTTGEGFGERSLDRSGDLLAVGTTESPSTITAGSAFVFRRSGTTWTLEDRMDGAPGTVFGRDVALDGDTLVVGAPTSTLLGHPATNGFARAYVRSGTTWTPQAVLTASDAAARDSFGGSVDVDGDRIVVGAVGGLVPGSSPPCRAGAVYVFERTGTQWSETAVFRGDASQCSTLGSDLGPQFGAEVALEGDRFVVGSPTFETGVPGQHRGAVHVYELESGAWVETTRLTSPLSFSSHVSGFGSKLALDGERLGVGNPIAATALGIVVGAVHLYEFDGTAWTREATLFASDPRSGNGFGSSLDLDGGLLAVGEPNDRFEGVPQIGRVTVYRLGPHGWLENLEFRIQGAATETDFGTTVQLHGSELLVGAGRDGPVPQAGAVYEFRLSVSPHAVFCSGNGTGCVACPCGNDTASFHSGGCRNDSDWSATLEASGNASLSDGRVGLSLRGATPEALALLLSAEVRLPSAGSCPPGSGVVLPAHNGLRCIGSDLRRHGTRSTDAQGRARMLTIGAGAPHGFVADQLRHFQAVYRTPGQQGCSGNLNTSNGVSITFRP